MIMEMSQYLFDRGRLAIAKAVEEGKLPDINYDAYIQKLYYILIETNYNLPYSFSEYVVNNLIHQYKTFGSMFTNREKAVFFKEYVEITPKKWLRAKDYTQEITEEEASRFVEEQSYLCIYDKSMNNLLIRFTTYGYFPYKVASVADITIRIKNISSTYYGEQDDNHRVYKVTQGGSEEYFYALVSDGTITLGKNYRLN